MKHCKIHNQPYMDHVKECPICAGETMKPARPKIIPKEVKELAENLKEKKSLDNLTKSKFKRKLKPFI